MLKEIEAIVKRLFIDDLKDLRLIKIDTGEDPGGVEGFWVSIYWGYKDKEGIFFTSRQNYSIEKLSASLYESVKDEIKQIKLLTYDKAKNLENKYD